MHAFTAWYTLLLQGMKGRGMNGPAPVARCAPRSGLLHEPRRRRHRYWLLVLGAACTLWCNVRYAPAASAVAADGHPAATATAPSAAPVTLAQTYREGYALPQYWVSEKYDGIRAYWTGQQLRSRQGQTIDAPGWFTQGWPQQPLDGELWAGRGQFALVQSAVGSGRSNDAGWRQLRFMVFDLPAHPGPFTARLQQLRTTVAAVQQPWLQAAPQWRVDSHAALMRQLRALDQAGAEGLMLRHADSPYRAGRSEDLLKLKLHDDAEAVVIGHVPGRGKYQGMTGALWVQTPQGQRFKLGSGLSDAERAAPPAMGSTVTYRYNGTHPSGLPRFARFWRVRATPADTAPSQTP